MNRLSGLDLARYFAFVGMVIVNFKIVMGAGASDGALSILIQALEGRAAATFVVLAGIGFGLAAARDDFHQTLFVTLKRAAFLLVLGLLNTLIFDADIIHYYAFYFLFGALCLPFSNRALFTIIVCINLIFVSMLFVVDYDTGWNWYDYAYVDFWTPAGFIRNLFYNGWHPVFPWLSFLLFGIILSRFDLAQRSVQIKMVIFGLLAYAVVETASAMSISQFAAGDDDLKALLGTSPIPPTPWYIMVGMAVASASIGLCLFSARWFEKIGLLRILLPAGRQTLTLYIAHIIVGMGTLDAFDMLGGQTLEFAVGTALIFCAAATMFAFIWSKAHERGPIEALMRKVAG